MSGRDMHALPFCSKNLALSYVLVKTHSKQAVTVWDDLTSVPEITQSENVRFRKIFERT